MQTDDPTTPRHDDRWFEADASYKGMKYFNRHYGSGKDGYKAGSADFFDKESFVSGKYSSYINPRTTRKNTSSNSISGKFHWTDIAIYSPWRIKLALYYVISH